MMNDGEGEEKKDKGEGEAWGCLKRRQRDEGGPRWLWKMMLMEEGKEAKRARKGGFILPFPAWFPHSPHHLVKELRKKLQDAIHEPLRRSD